MTYDNKTTHLCIRDSSPQSAMAKSHVPRLLLVLIFCNRGLSAVVL